jgi:type I restriction enzyme, S subunit
MNHPQVPLGEVADFVNGAAFKPEDWGEDGLPIIRIQNLTDSGKPFNYTERVVPDKLVVNPGDLLVSWSATLGVFQWNGPKGLLNQHIFRVLSNDEVVDKNYLKHTLGQAINDMERHLHGATMKHVNRGEFLGTRIPLPPLEEQRRIAAILDKASRIAELCGTALKLSHAADKSLFLHFFADLPEESDLLLEELSYKRSNAIRTGPFGSQLLHGEFTDSGVAVLGIDNAVNNSFEWSKRRFISHEKYEQLKRYTVYPGDLLITIMGTCGRAAVVPDDIPQAINTKHLCAISVDRSVVLPEYLHSYILFHPSASRYLSQRTKGAIMEGLNMTIIKELPVAVPPVTHQMAWLARRKILRAASKRAQSMSASALSLRQSFSYNLLEERGA